MPSAEATLDLQAQVGKLPATTLQTLQDILNLYISGNTDHDTWAFTIESNPLLLRPFVAASDNQLERWADAYTISGMRSLALVLVNQIANKASSQTEPDQQTAVMLAREIASHIDQGLRRRAEIATRLVDSDLAMADMDTRAAVVNARRPLAQLFDAPLLTRIIAIAIQSAEPATRDPALCAELLATPSLDANAFNKLFEQADAIPTTPETISPERVCRLLTLANIQSAVARLAEDGKINKALRELTSIFFNTVALDIYLQFEHGWTNGTDHLESHRTLVGLASISGKVTSSSSHEMTLVDENLVSHFGTDEAIAIPILLDDHPDSCAAVVTVGLSKAQVLESIGDHERIGDFQLLCRSILHEATGVEQKVSRDAVDLKAREIIHEASNPLSTIANYLKVLSLQLGPDHDAQSTIDTIGTEIQRTGEIIKSFREVTHDLTVSEDKCYPGRELKRICTLFSKANENVSIRINTEGEDHPIAIGATAFGQITTNLIKNAIEAMNEHGEIIIRIVSGIQMPQQLMTEISVSDNGPGFARELGDVFTRGTTSKLGDHAGEGLAVVKTLTEAVAGFVSYRSSDAGTEIRITIPQVDTGT